MSTDQIILKSNWRQRLFWSALTCVLLFTRVIWQPRGFNALGIVAVRDLVLTLSLWLLSLALFFTLGSRLLNLLQLRGIGCLEQIVFSFALGLGSVAYWLLALGLLKLLNVTSIMTSMIVLTTFLAPDMSELVAKIRTLPRIIKRTWQDASLIAKSILLICLAIFGLSLVNSLTPPWGYDGLMYHLVGPKMFLQEGGLFPYPDNWYVNGPFTIEMVFTLGMAFGDDVYPRLIHLSLGVLFVAATVAIANRWMNQERTWLTLALLMGIPILPIWASLAYIDLGWSAYEILAISALLIWWHGKNLHWLMLSGILIGLAMGSKYLGLMGFGLIGIFILIVIRRDGWRRLIKTVFAFALPAIAIASPWYLKNWIWFRTPVFPLFFNESGWSEIRLGLYNAFLMSFGVGKTALDFILLPYNIFVYNTNFSALMNQIDIPNPLFLLLFLYPFVRRERIASALLFLSMARFVIWALGSQQIRFLLPIYPFLAISTAYLVTNLIPARLTRKALHKFPRFLVVGILFITLYYQLIIILQMKTVGVSIGMESRSNYLSRVVRDYPAVEFMLSSIPESKRVLLFGNGQSYYCLPKCIPDPDHFRWAGEIASLSSDSELGPWFRRKGVSYLLLSREYLDFLLQHDPEGVMKYAIGRINRWSEAGCLNEVYRDEWNVLYKVVCEDDMQNANGKDGCRLSAISLNQESDYLI